MSVFVAGNHVSLLRNGTEYFPALIRAIEAAQHEVYLQTYIFEDDDTGRQVAAALANAVTRGAAVYLLLDGFGCKDLSRSLLLYLQKSGVEVLFFRPKISPWTLKKRRLRRLHWKVAIIDGARAFVGGINIIDDMNTPDHTPPRVDYAVQVEGPLVRHIHIHARRVWRRVAWASLRHINPRKPRLSLASKGNMTAALVIRDNLWHRRDIEKSYLFAIESAQHEIIIANSYFLPGVRFRRALVAASNRGVRVALLLQARVEYLLLDYASRALYDQFLKAGIEIHEYHVSFMHSKVAVIDGSWATIGSSNIDPFSLSLAREANVVVTDSAFASDLRCDLERSMVESARRIRPEDWQHAPRHRRVLAWLVYGLIRLMMSVIGYPHK